MSSGLWRHWWRLWRSIVPLPSSPASAPGRMQALSTCHSPAGPKQTDNGRSSSNNNDYADTDRQADKQTDRGTECIEVHEKGRHSARAHRERHFPSEIYVYRFASGAPGPLTQLPTASTFLFMQPAIRLTLSLVGSARLCSTALFDSVRFGSARLGRVRRRRRWSALDFWLSQADARK